MTHYLRFGDDNLVDLEATKDDIRCVVDVRTFALALLSLPKADYAEFITDMYFIQEIRAEYHEAVTTPPDTNAFAKHRLEEVRDRWRKLKLFYVTD